MAIEDTDQELKDQESKDRELKKALTGFFETEQQVRLVKQAKAFAEGGSPQVPEYLRALVAMLYPENPVTPPPRRRFFDLFSPFTTVLAGMTMVFGFLGLVPGIFGPSQDVQKTFLDIAKIFAGAVVGATGNTIGSAPRRSTSP